MIQSETKIKGVLEGAADAIFITDKEGCWQYVNSQDEILKRADQAMYRAKDAGRNSIFLFESGNHQPKAVMDSTDH